MKEVQSAASLSLDDKVIVLKRNLNHEIGSNDAWSAVPVIGFEIDEDDLDLQIDTSGTHKALSLGELETKLRTILPNGAELDIFVKGDWKDVPNQDEWQSRRDIPVVGSVVNKSERLFGVMMWYEGIDTEFADES